LKSIDTNLLVYALNRICPEYPAASAFLQSALDEPTGWILSDQVYFELYKALRNPKIFSKPLGAPEAFSKIDSLREQSGFLRCHYSDESWDAISSNLRQNGFPYQRTHDCILAQTLRQMGVTVFYTRNSKDFLNYGFESVINPIDS
jgi:uncharacterized protein